MEVAGWVFAGCAPAQPGLFPCSAHSSGCSSPPNWAVVTRATSESTQALPPVQNGVCSQPWGQGLLSPSTPCHEAPSSCHSHQAAFVVWAAVFVPPPPGALLAPQSQAVSAPGKLYSQPIFLPVAFNVVLLVKNTRPPLGAVQLPASQGPSGLKPTRPLCPAAGPLPLAGPWGQTTSQSCRSQAVCPNGWFRHWLVSKKWVYRLQEEATWA